VAEVARGGWRFIVWSDTAGRRLSAAQLRELVMRGKTRLVRFVSDRGVELDGRLVLDHCHVLLNVTTATSHCNPDSSGYRLRMFLLDRCWMRIRAMV
jgi:hypothetical protein